MNFRFVLCLLFFFGQYSLGRTQVDPSDPLGSAFRISARAKVKQFLNPKSCAVFFSGGFELQGPNLVEPRIFHAEPSFHYLTGLNYPDAVLVILPAKVSMTEGMISEILFLPNPQDQTLNLMGMAWKGKFGLHSGELAIRPASQWRKFCLEILAAEEMQTVYANTAAMNNYDKRGYLAYEDLGSIFFNTLAPGFPFDPSAQGFYNDILRADSAALKQLKIKAEAMLGYYPSLRRDPILASFTQARTPGDISAVQAQIRAIKIDVATIHQQLLNARLMKSAAEQKLIAESAKICADAMAWTATGKISGRTERQLQAMAHYFLGSKGAEVVYASRVAAGANAIAPNYFQAKDTISGTGSVIVDIMGAWKGYHTRITRTLPADGRFAGKDLELYNAVRGAHSAGLGACKSGERPSEVLKKAQSELEDMLKRLGVGTGKGVQWVFDASSCGLDLNEMSLPTRLETGMTLVVETSVFIGNDQAVKAEWRGKAVSLRDVVLVQEGSTKVLTSSMTSDAGGIEALLAKAASKPLD